MGRSAAKRSKALSSAVKMYLPLFVALELLFVYNLGWLGVKCEVWDACYPR